MIQVLNYLICGCLICIGVAVASPTSVPPQTVNVFLANAHAAQQAGHAQKALHGYQQAMRLKSGYAALMAGQLLEKQGNIAQAIDAYQQAVRYGFPTRGYQALATLYRQHHPVHTELAACYANLAQPVVDQNLRRSCTRQFPLGFRVIEQAGVQTKVDAAWKAQQLADQFCHGQPVPRLQQYLDARTVSALRAVLCHSQRIAPLNLPDRAIVLTTARHLEQYDQTVKQYRAYHAPLLEGDIVYVQNPPYTPYLYTKGQLMVINDGMRRVSPDGHVFIYHHGQWVHE